MTTKASGLPIVLLSGESGFFPAETNDLVLFVDVVTGFAIDCGFVCSIRLGAVNKKRCSG